MNGYIGSNDVLYWYYNSQQVSQGKTGIYFWMFGIFTFLAPLWQHLFWLLISILSQLSWTVWVDTEIRELEKKHCTYLSFGLSFKFWDMNKPDSKFFCPDPESERLTFNKKNTSSSAECEQQTSNSKTWWKGTSLVLIWLESWNLFSIRQVGGFSFFFVTLADRCGLKTMWNFQESWLLGFLTGVL